MICPNCRHTVRDGAKFCDECGIVLSPSSAGTTNVGAAARPRAQRPPTAVPPRAQTFRTNAAPRSHESQLSPTPFSASTDSLRARRLFALAALAGVFMLCTCCALAVGGLWLYFQTP